MQWVNFLRRNEAGQANRDRRQPRPALFRAVDDSRPAARRTPGRHGSGFTLLEVVLALAILAVSMAALGEVLRMGGESSRISRDLTQAQLIASTKLAELTSGAAVLDSISNATVEEIDSEPPWLFSIEIGTTLDPNLVAVRVTVKQDLPENLDPATYSIVRWMQDPTAVAATTGTTTSGSTTGSTTSGGVR